MKKLCLPIMNIGIRGGAASGIPSENDALFWLDGTISGVQFIDKSGNGRHFTITGKDWAGNYFPYKTAATISAPVGDATLIAEDVNNFLYTAGTPNEIPVVSFFQNIDYNNKLFCRHVSQATDANGVETQEPYVTDIVLYDTALTGNDLLIANAFYEVPTDDSNIVVGPEVGDDYTTISAAITAASSGQTIYVKTGIYAEQVSIAKTLNVIGIGGAVVQSTTAQGLYVNAVTNAYVKGLVIDGVNGSSMCVYLTTTAVNATLERCYLFNSAANRTLYQREGTTTSTIKDCVLTGDLNHVLFETTSQTDIIGCFFGGSGNSVSAYSFTTGTYDISITYCKVRRTGTTNPTFQFGNAYTDITISYNDVDVPTCGFVFDVNGTGTGTYTVNYNVVNIDSATSTFLYQRAGMNNVTIQNNRFTTASGKQCVQFAGILSGDIIIENNFFEITTFSALGYFVIVGGANSTLIRGNTLISKNSAVGDSYGIYVGISSTTQTESYIIEKNKIYSPEYYGSYASVGGLHGAIFAIDVTNVIIRHNLIMKSIEVGNIILKGNGVAMTSSAIYGNICVGGHIIVKGVEDAVVYNNTLDAGYCIDILNGDADEPCTGTIAKNNLFIGYLNEVGTKIVQLFQVEVETGLDFDYNIFYSESGLNIATREVAGIVATFAEWQAFGQDANGDYLSASEFAALFNNIVANDYSLPVNSPAIGAALSLAATYDDGLDASTVWGDDTDLPNVVTKQRAGAWDVGAYVS